MTKLRKIATIFLICILSFAFVGCSKNILKDVFKKTEVNPYKDSIYNSSREANKKGLELIDLDKVESSIEYFEEALRYALEYQELEDDKESEIVGDLLSDAYNNLCLAYYILGQYEQSLECGNLSIEILPNDSLEYSNRGNAYYGLYRYEEAMEDYNKAVEIDSKNSYAYYGRGSVYYVWEDYEKSLLEFDKSLTYKPDDVDAYVYKIWCHYYLGNFDEGIEVSDKAISIDENDIEIYRAKGQIILAKSGYDEAEAYYRMVADSFSDKIEAQMLIGRLYYNNENYKAALDCFLKIKDNLGTNDSLNCWIISCYTALGDMNLADKYFNDLLSDGEATTYFCNYVGDDFTYYGYYMEALKYYEEAMRIDETDKTAYYNMLYSLFYGKRYNRCIEFGKKMINKFGEDYDACGYIGESYYYLYEYEKALEWYELAYNIRPKSDVVISYIGDVYLLLEDYENAKKYADLALSLNHENVTAKNTKKIIESRLRPTEVQVSEFIKTYYLYNTDNKVDEIFNSNSMSNEDIANALENIKISDDIFTFCIYDDVFDYYYEECMLNVDYQDYGYMHYIRIYDFNENIDDQVIEILDNIKNPKNCVLIIDLRMNGGGDTQASNNILDALLPNCVTCTLFDKDGYTYNYYSDASQIKFDHIYILVDEDSASASELLTLGLKTYLDNVTIIGDNTYGKGVGQMVYEDKNRKLMIFLVDHYWNVREQNIKETGITPDIHMKSEELSDYIDLIEELVSAS